MAGQLEDVWSNNEQTATKMNKQPQKFHAENGVFKGT